MTTRKPDTKSLLLASAEKLFAEYGIAAVSPRQIALAANQHNQSALYYHFGSKEELIEALLEVRMANINLRRLRMLEEMEQQGRMHDMRSLLGAIAFPLVHEINKTDGGGYYVRFLAHLFADRTLRDILITHGEQSEILQRVYSGLRSLTQALPEQLWTERLRFVVGGIINALAGREKMRANGEQGWYDLPEQAYINNLIDVGMACLFIPASFDTLSHMQPPE